MRRAIFRLVLVLGVALVMAGQAPGATVYLYADTAPNVYGSPDWDPWWSATKSDVVSGTFVNMRSGRYPGHDWMDPYEEIVYSTMDLGHRLHWIYWIPGESMSSLADRFQVRWVVDWDGVSYTYDLTTYSLIEATPDNGWVTPAHWEDYDDGTHQGVIGTFGFAWWAYDDLADPLSTDLNPYNEVDMADVDALRAEVFRFQTFALGQARIRENATSDWVVVNRNIQVVPEPATIFLVGSGLLGLAARGRNRRARHF